MNNCKNHCYVSIKVTYNNQKLMLFTLLYTIISFYNKIVYNLSKGVETIVLQREESRGVTNVTF